MYEFLNQWFQTAQGLRVAEAFSQELRAVGGHISGNNLLQLGVCGSVDWISSLRFRQKMFVSPSFAIKNASFYASINNLPLDRNSVDCVLAPLTMEFFVNNNYPLDEIDRILKSQGYIIFFGINPCSFWGLAAYLGKLPHLVDRSLTLRSSLCLKNSLFSRGYRQCFLNSFFYIPPVTGVKMLRRLEFLNEMGKMVWTYPAGFYCFIVQKRDPCAPFLQDEQDDIDLAFRLN